MSQSDSIDDEVKRILAETGSDDSVESNNSKKIKSHENKEGKIQYETNNYDDDDSEW